MRRFSQLFETLDATTSTLGKIAALRQYFSAAPPQDAAWAVYFLSGRRLKQLVGPAMLGRWLEAAANLPGWLVAESHAAVGDLAETIALLLAGTAPPATDDLSLDEWIRQRLMPLPSLPQEEQQQHVTRWWRELDAPRCFLLTKLLTGALRVGVSQTLVERALAETLTLPREVIAHRLMGTWEPTALFWQTLHAAADTDAVDSRPYPFFLANPLEQAVETLGAREDWIVEWKWDGIRGQVIRRQDACFIWSRGEELITERFPEVTAAAMALPAGTVLDGEILVWTTAGVQPFGELQKRIGRKKLSPALLASVPVHFLAYDLLELDGRDIRALPLHERREQLTRLLADHRGVLDLSPTVAGETWTALTELRRESRARNVEGFMIKHRQSAYGTGRRKGMWWKWKVDPFTFDGVLLYAQAGSGQRASLFTDYTFGVWQAGELVPVAKAYSGLTNAEIAAVDRWIRQNTVERFGPVRAVRPELVFEIAFEAINVSRRHKAGLAVRFPRISRWRRDKPSAEADTIEQLKALLPASQANLNPADIQTVD